MKLGIGDQNLILNNFS